MKSCSDSKPCRKDPYLILGTSLTYPSVLHAISPPMERTIRSSRSSLPLPFSSSGHAPFITVVQPAHLRYRDDLALPHDPPSLWRILGLTPNVSASGDNNPCNSSAIDVGARGWALPHGPDIPVESS